MKRISLFSAAAIPALAIATASPAYAQSAQPEAEPAAAAGEIVITAQGRAQQLADVPLAVSAVNSEQMQNSGANDIRQLNQVAPSLLVSSTGSEANGSARIRGIGTVGDNPGLESSVAPHIDAVHPRRDRLAQRHVQIGAEPQQVVIAIGCLGAARKAAERRRLRHDADDAGRRVAPEQRPLWSLQDFDALDVVELLYGSRRRRLIEFIDIKGVWRFDLTGEVVLRDASDGHQPCKFRSTS